VLFCYYISQQFTQVFIVIMAL